MKETVIYDVELIETILKLLNDRIIPQMSFRGSDDVLIVSDIIHALREQGRIQKTDTSRASKEDENITPSDANCKNQKN